MNNKDKIKKFNRDLLIIELAKEITPLLVLRKHSPTDYAVVVVEYLEKIGVLDK